MNSFRSVGQQSSSCLTHDQLSAAMDQLAHNATAEPGTLLLCPGVVPNATAQTQATGGTQGQRVGSIQALDTTIDMEPQFGDCLGICVWISSDQEQHQASILLSLIKYNINNDVHVLVGDNPHFGYSGMFRGSLGRYCNVGNRYPEQTTVWGTS